MKHKRLNRDGWGFQYYPYYQMRIDCDFFHGTACLIKFTDGEKKLTYMTDIGCMRESMLEYAAGSSLVFIEANHDVEMLKNGTYPYYLKQRILSDHGHLSNENCGKALVKLYETGVRFAVLGHLSRENNTEYEAYSTVSRVLEEANICDMKLIVAKRSEITGDFRL